MNSSIRPWQVPALEELAIRRTAAHAKGRVVDAIYGEWSVIHCSPAAPVSDGASKPEPGRAGPGVGPAHGLSDDLQFSAVRAWQAPAMQELTVGAQ
jgi:hypothetical protein